MSPGTLVVIAAALMILALGYLLQDKPKPNAVGQLKQTVVVGPGKPSLSPGGVQ